MEGKEREERRGKEMKGKEEKERKKEERGKKGERKGERIRRKKGKEIPLSFPSIPFPIKGKAPGPRSEKVVSKSEGGGWMVEVAVLVGCGTEMRHGPFFKPNTVQVYSTLKICTLGFF